MELGGGFNAHLHLDRAGTLQKIQELQGQRSWAEKLEKKHSLIEVIHQSDAYSPEALYSRAVKYIDLLVKFGSTNAESFIDVTSDGIGVRGIAEFANAKEKRSQEINLRLGSYNPLGFKLGDSACERLLLDSMQYSSFVGCLPERDDSKRYPDHIGFKASCRLHYELAISEGKDLHVHVDQRNDPSQNEAEQFLEAVDDIYKAPPVDSVPEVWLVHLISPSRYPESRFMNLAKKLASLNVGVICCPSAALSMRQLRGRMSPTSNSIARVLDLISEGVHVRIGCDNIYDVASPAGTPDLVEEIVNLANAERFYDLDILSAIASGRKLTNEQRLIVGEHLEADRTSVAQLMNDL